MIIRLHKYELLFYVIYSTLCFQTLFKHFQLADEVLLLIFSVTSTVHENVLGEGEQIDDIWDHLGLLPKTDPAPELDRTMSQSIFSSFFPEIYVLYHLYTFALKTVKTF